MTTPPEPHYRISAAVMAMAVKADQEQRAEIAQLRDRLALAEQALEQAGHHEDRLRAVVEAARQLVIEQQMADELGVAVWMTRTTRALARLDETAPPVSRDG